MMIKFIAGTQIVVLHEDAERILLGRRAKLPGIGSWAFPGGRIDEGEQPAETAWRELKEETGITDISGLFYEGRPFATYDGIPVIHFPYMVYALDDPSNHDGSFSDFAWWHFRADPPGEMFTPSARVLESFRLHRGGTDPWQPRWGYADEGAGVEGEASGSVLGCP